MFVFKPDSVRRVIAYAEAEKADHVVLFPRMIMEHPGERMMISFFQALFALATGRGRLLTRRQKITWELGLSIW